MVTRGGIYRIKTSTITLVPDAEGRKIATTIPKGAIVEVVDVPIEGSSSLTVRWEGKTCEMFTQDLCERGEQVRSVRDSRDRLPF